jgi:hypothetical protein
VAVGGAIGGCSRLPVDAREIGRRETGDDTRKQERRIGAKEQAEQDSGTRGCARQWGKAVKR